MDGRFVAYYRVSKDSQGIKGLGMDAQHSAVTAYLNGGDWELIAEFEEVESGKRDDRPELAKAIERCRMTGAKLLIAKLDRLSRDVHFLTGLEKQGIEFVACDMPQANRFTIHIMAAVAQQEREMISARTKASLASIKAKLANGEEYVSKRSGKRVERLGGANGFGTNARSDLGRKARTAKANEFASKMAPTAKALKDGGMTLQQVADHLNQIGSSTPRGASWTPMTVKRVLDRAA